MASQRGGSGWKMTAAPSSRRHRIRGIDQHIYQSKWKILSFTPPWRWMRRGHLPVNLVGGNGERVWDPGESLLPTTRAQMLDGEKILTSSLERHPRGLLMASHRLFLGCNMLVRDLLQDAMSFPPSSAGNLLGLTTTVLCQMLVHPQKLSLIVRKMYSCVLHSPCHRFHPPQCNDDLGHPLPQTLL